MENKAKAPRAKRAAPRMYTKLANRLRPVHPTYSPLLQVLNPTIVQRSASNILVYQKNAECQGFVMAHVPWDSNTQFPLGPGDFCRTFPPENIVRYEDIETPSKEPRATAVFGRDVYKSVRWHMHCNEEFYGLSKDMTPAEVSLAWARGVNWHLLGQYTPPDMKTAPPLAPRASLAADLITDGVMLPRVVFPWMLNNRWVWLDELRAPTYTSPHVTDLTDQLTRGGMHTGGRLTRELAMSIGELGSSFPGISPMRSTQVACLLEYLQGRLLPNLAPSCRSGNPSILVPAGGKDLTFPETLYYERATFRFPTMYYGLQERLDEERLQAAADRARLAAERRAVRAAKKLDAAGS